MLTFILTSIIAYISTNIDDIFVLMILLAQVRNKRSLIAGHFLGVVIILDGTNNFSCIMKKQGI